jgi:uncharacterized membrane protein
MTLGVGNAIAGLIALILLALGVWKAIELVPKIFAMIMDRIRGYRGSYSRKEHKEIKQKKKKTKKWKKRSDEE